MNGHLFRAWDAKFSLGGEWGAVWGDWDEGGVGKFFFFG